jgi:CRP/FNR family transcriptional regulator, cyclic AMP receptor protein
MRTKKLSSKAQLLQQLMLFRACSPKELELAASLMDEVDVPAGAELTREGASGAECFIIASGTATVTLNGDKLNELGPGDSVGEMALLDHAPRSATVTADTPMHLLVLTPQSLDRLLMETPIAKGLLRALARRLRDLENAPHW